ncbi:hypothetical protein B0H13DRAFT_2315278 [Mycena leptocephala]|nr:hypothetical protein B0H13DRAFT_2315278 [Mycena leptocephala]
MRFDHNPIAPMITATLGITATVFNRPDRSARVPDPAFFDATPHSAVALLSFAHAPNTGLAVQKTVWLSGQPQVPLKKAAVLPALAQHVSRMSATPTMQPDAVYGQKNSKNIDHRERSSRI